MKNVIITISFILFVQSICARGAELFVPSQYSTIQSAIDAAVNGDTIIVAPGTYIGEGNRDIKFLGKAITVRSQSGPDNCTINCNGTKAEPHRGFYFHYQEGANSILEGFTIIRGYTNDYGGGIFCKSSSPIIINCTIIGNSARGGGAVGCFESSPTIINCTITGNLAGNEGGGIYGHYGGYHSSPIITNCIITCNSASYYGGGIGDCYGSVANCIITGNSAYFGGGGLAFCGGPITNCTIAGNYSGEGGGLLECRGPISNCIITNNTADYDGGGLFFTGPITNSIIWGNWPDQIRTFHGSPTVIYSDVQGSYPGLGNIDADPCFALSSDYHIMPTSPCINTGDPNYIPEPNETDLDGLPRIIGGRIDMGAYEYNPNTPLIAASAVNFYFYFMQDCPKPNPQILLIRNAGDEPLNWEIIENCDWLEITPTNGFSDGQINTVTIAVDPNDLTRGVHTCIFEIRDPNASNNPVTICVTLLVRGILRVPSQDFNTIQDAINAAINYEIVLVSDGIYTGNGNRDIDLKGKAITVRSENGPDNCIIDCNDIKAVPHRGFYFHSGEDTSSIVEGFTIIRGRTNDYGGGIYCSSSSPVISNCTITNNTAAVRAGGIYCEHSSPTINNCNIARNAAKYGGGIYCHSSSPTITNCIITDNSAFAIGGGMFCVLSSSPIITDCAITGNSGGGMFCESYSSPIITNCTITRNSTDYDGGGIRCNQYCCPIITNCEITGNSADAYGGGIYCIMFSSPIITNCEITGNSANNNGGGMYFGRRSNPIINNSTIASNTTVGYGGGILSYYLSNPTVTNCIFWGNTAEVNGNQIALNMAFATYTTTLTILYSDVEGGLASVFIESGCSVIWGLGNINADPCFVSSGYWVNVNDPNIIVEPNDPNAIWLDGDYHLLPNSPCINIGDLNYAPEPNETDLDGNPRIAGGRIDMGAYESIMHEARLWISPQVINTKSQQPEMITAWMYLPEGITEGQVDNNTPLTLCPPGIEAAEQFVMQNRGHPDKRTRVLAFFDREEFLDFFETGGSVQLMVLGRLLEPGQFFFGSDTIRITPPPPIRPWW